MLFRGKRKWNSAKNREVTGFWSSFAITIPLKIKTIFCNNLSNDSFKMNKTFKKFLFAGENIEVNQILIVTIRDHLPNIVKGLNISMKQVI